MTRRLTDDAAAILRAAVAAADPRPATDVAIRALNVDGDEVVHLIALGKAALPMMDAALTALSSPPASALAVTPRGTCTSPRTYDVIEAAHPIPDDSSLRAGHNIAARLSIAAPTDIFILLISGGASSLAVLPVEGISVDAYAARVGELLAAGADIVQLNTFRQRIDRLKGGGMARMTTAHIHGLIVSDVVGNRLDIIASGPLTPPASEPHDVHNADVTIILDNAVARAGAAAHATRLGYDVHLLDDAITGEARDAATAFARRLELIAASAARPVCLIAGGETTVTVNGSGTGGRNQEFALAAAFHLPPLTAIGSIGTDGVDGPTDAAGAVAESATLDRIRDAGIDPAAALRSNDSYTALRAASSLIATGPTGTNVMDVMIGLALPA